MALDRIHTKRSPFRNSLCVEWLSLRIHYRLRQTDFLRRGVVLRGSLFHDKILGHSRPLKVLLVACDCHGHELIMQPQSLQKHTQGTSTTMLRRVQRILCIPGTTFSGLRHF
jgi:hypothetical protein